MTSVRNTRRSEGVAWTRDDILSKSAYSLLARTQVACGTSNDDHGGGSPVDVVSRRRVTKALGATSESHKPGLWIIRLLVMLLSIMNATPSIIFVAADDASNRPEWIRLDGDRPVPELFRSSEVLQMYHIQVGGRSARDWYPRGILASCVAELSAYIQLAEEGRGSRGGRT